MQTIKTFLRCDGTRATLVDGYNNAVATRPTFTLCLNSVLALELFHGGDDSSKYTQAELSGYSWKFYAHNTYNANDPLLATESGITATDGVISVPLDSTGNAVSAWLGTAESGTLHGELQGYTAGGECAEMVLQFDITIRNRVKR